MKRRKPGVGCRQPGKKACRRDAVTTVDDKRLCAVHAADRLFARRVRESGPCFAAGYKFACNGGLQCCHIITRARRPTRWADDNALPGCAAHHVWFTHNVDEFRAYIVDMGIDYDALHWRAWHAPAPDPLEIVEELTHA